MRPPSQLSRRGVLVAAGAAIAGLAVAVKYSDAMQSIFDGGSASEFKPNAYLEISADGRIVVIVGQSEIGQGIHTCLAQALADELDADWSMVTTRHSLPGKEFQFPSSEFGPGVQMIAESASTRYFFEPMRLAGAVARILIIRAAARVWRVAEDACSTSQGYVIARDGRKAPYRDFVLDAAKLPMPDPKDVRLKSPEKFTLIGQSMPRIEGTSKIRGEPIFGIDVRLHGMLTAVVARSPVLGGRLIRVDDRATRKMPGVRACLRIGDAIAVVAEGFWAAKTGRDLLKIDWDPGTRGNMSSPAMEAEYREALQQPGFVVLERGAVAASPEEAARRYVADYTMPYLAHAPMEPLNCTMQWRGKRCEIWVGTQYQSMDHAVAARVLFVPQDYVTLNTMHCGGGFGRRASPKSDFVAETARIMKAGRFLDAPIQNIWTREDDIQGGEYRPMAFNRLSAALSDKGEIASWNHRIVSQSILDDTEFASWNAGGYDALSVGGAINLAYDVENFRLEIHTPKNGPTVSWMRAPGEVSNSFAIECFVDELAERAGIDPVAFRLRMLGKDPRLAHVLEVAAKAGGLREKLPAGAGRGVAVHAYVDSKVAAVADVAMVDGRLHVRKFTVAIDCGRIVNPDGVRSQVEGGVIFALTSALYGRISFDQGRVEQASFDNYPLVRMESSPEVEVHLVEGTEGPFGVGEVACPPVAPALCNAIYIATGRRIRDLPVTTSLEVR